MEVKPGYKQTEVGIIPDDWDGGALGDNSEKVGSGITPTGGARVYKSAGRPFLRSQNVGWGVLLLDDVAFIDDATHATFADTEIRSEDVFLNITGASIGRSAVADSRILGGNVNQHVCIIRANQAKLVPHYLNYFLLSSAGQRQIDSFQAGGNRQGLNFGHVRSIRLPLPKPPEQRAIAEALSDVDGLLGGLDRLIAKKRDLKQAAMQQLLTGQTRLPGFHGEWEVRTLKEVCWFQEGPGVRNTQFTSSGIKLLNGTNIFRGALKLDTTTRFISENEGRGAYAHFLADDGDIVLASSGITIERLHEKVAFVRPQDLPFCMNTSTIRFKPFAGILAPAFLFQFLTGDDFKRRIGGTATGSAQLNFGPSHVEKVELSVPPHHEQTAIAEVLTAMDAELTALEQRREKTRALKQAMMQELLTGRTRLV